jgi:succinate dehydrogenase hydrophobic membrane anchor protein
MTARLSHDRIEAQIFSWLQKVPFVAACAKTRGWYFVAAWTHRFTGLLMVLLAWGHIAFFGSAIPMGIFWVWLFAFSCVFHGLNGGRLILYESFGNRNDESLMHWVLGLSLLYLGVLALVTLSGGQNVAPTFFWVIAVLTGLVLGYGTTLQIWSSAHSIFWRLQRISGIFLLPVLPAYLLFMQLTLPAAGDGDILRVSLQSGFIKLVFLLTMASAVYHGAYGLFSVVGDYVRSRIIKSASAVLITLLAFLVAGIGVKAIFGG